ncbi:MULTISPECIES: AraC family transcriptional regulator [Ruminococcus]|uniref:Stage 0 sporulation protein A homolog n=1 Tax=Ruminococcus albus (strain ATCC 27210 / DSM 20455 / JCM 14654 / NCDO 2250 / 7) TaxID=697329 RepID=E6UBB7_RUMA7|nr:MULTISPECIES: helix-turn-helix domain-containing protein [Ruminococcus]ADU21467.1 transcriptional regulator, AraC family [Ruminococcus albus 7 = DSM 20455]MCR5019440.1 helix-turn-helix domain-containing protein [Ruminococcus sp.]
MTAPIKVLLAESDTVRLKRYKSMSLWRELGMSAENTASTAYEAVKILDNEEIGLVVAVDRPPVSSADIVLKKCAEKGIPAVVIVPRTEGAGIGRYFSMGACDVIAEPPSRTRLRHALMTARRYTLKDQAGEEYCRAAEKAFAVLKRGDQGFISKLKELIVRSEGETVTTGAAAEYFRFNRDYFGKLFKQETGMTFNSFYNNFRIEYAKELLGTGRLRVCEISELLGFSSVDYFTGVFRRQTGLTPTGYRAACQ